MHTIYALIMYVESNPVSCVTFHICPSILSGATPQQSYDNLLSWFDWVVDMSPAGCHPCFGKDGRRISGIYCKMSMTQCSDLKWQIGQKLETWNARCILNDIFTGSIFKCQGNGSDCNDNCCHWPSKRLLNVYGTHMDKNSYFFFKG